MVQPRQRRGLHQTEQVYAVIIFSKIIGGRVDASKVPDSLVTAFAFRAMHADLLKCLGAKQGLKEVARWQKERLGGRAGKSLDRELVIEHVAPVCPEQPPGKGNGVGGERDRGQKIVERAQGRLQAKEFVAVEKQHPIRCFHQIVLVRQPHRLPLHGFIRIGAERHVGYIG